MGTSMFISQNLQTMGVSLKIIFILTVLPTSMTAACPTNLCNCLSASQTTQNLRVIDCRNKGLTHIPFFTASSERFYEITFKNNDGCSNCNTIKSVQDGAFSNLTLERIDLSGVRLNSISNGAFERQEASLVKLNIEGDKNIAPPLTAFTNLTNLQTLEMESFKLVSMDGDTFTSFPNLLTLTMKDMNIDVIGETTFYKKFPKLTTLSIKENPVLGNIPVSALRHLSTLQHLYLVNNEITQVTNRAFEMLTSLVSLDLSHNIINTMDPNCFHGLYAKLETLLLHLNNLENEDLVAISAPTWAKLHQINLGNNRIGNIPDGLFRNMPNIAYINLVDNSLTSITTADFAGITSLNHLDLSYNKIDYIEPGSFSQMTNITQFDFQNNLENSPTKKLNFTLEVIHGIHSSLQQINLMNTKVVETELWRLAKRLVNMKSFILRNTGLTGIPDFTFQSHSVLTNLDVRENKISSIKPETFYGLESSLDQLNLRNNNITTIDECVFKKFTKLHFFYMDFNPLYCDCGLKWIQDRLKSVPANEFYAWSGTCNDPANLKGQSVTTVNLSSLSCSSTALPCQDITPPTTESPATTAEIQTTTVTLPTIQTISVQASNLFSVKITWTVSSNEQINNYRVTYEKIGTSDKKTTGPISKSNTEYILQQLASGTPYTVCLMMELSISGQPNTECRAVTTLKEPTITVGIISKSTDRIRISWSVSDSTYVQSYSVQYEKLGDASTRNTVPRDKTLTDLTIDSLEAGFNYEICVTIMFANSVTGSKRCVQQATDDKPVTDKQQSDSNAGIIAGAVVGCVIAIVIIIAIIYILLICRGKPKAPPPGIQTTSFTPGSIPHIPNDARRFVKTKGKDGEPGDAIQIQSISGKMDPNDSRVSGGSYQFLNENGHVKMEPMSSAGKMSGANGSTADLPPSHYNYINHGYGQHGGQMLKPTYVNDPRTHSSSNPSHGAYMNDNDMRPLPKAPQNGNTGGSSKGFDNLAFKKGSSPTSPFTPPSQNVYNEIPL